MNLEPLSSPVREGEILDDKYRIEGLVGEGSMGIVVSAWHLDLRKRVAIKFLHPAIAARDQALERFICEARAVGRINSEHVARVFDVGRTSHGEPYIVMEYLAGRDMAVALQQGPLPIADAVEYVQQVCEALAEAHAAGMIHRDLKPANLFLDVREGGPRIKVLDFGISKMPTTEERAMTLTNPAAIMGSPAYMSPEQLRSTHDVDERTDIWAVGVILYEMLTGQVPFEGVTLAQMCTMILHSPAPAPRLLRPDLPLGLEAVVLRCLHKVAEQRFGNVAELSLALAPFGREGALASAARAARARRLSARGSTTQTEAPVAEPSAAPARPTRSRVVIAVGLLLALGAIVLAAMRARRPDDAMDGREGRGGVPSSPAAILAPADTIAAVPADLASTPTPASSSFLGGPAPGPSDGAAAARRPKHKSRGRADGLVLTPTRPANAAAAPEPVPPTNPDDYGGRK